MLLCVHVIYVGSFDMVILIGTPEHTHTHTTRTHKCTRTMGANFTPHIWLSTSHIIIYGCRLQTTSKDIKYGCQFCIGTNYGCRFHTSHMAVDFTQHHIWLPTSNYFKGHHLWLSILYRDPKVGRPSFFMNNDFWLIDLKT